jgi:RecA-family ATPase
VGGLPADLQPLPTIDPLRWQGQPVPEREWLVRDLVPLNNVTLLSGHGGTGKSFLMLQLLVCASLGLPWLGFETRQVKAAGFFAEDDTAELHRRLAAILRHYGREFGDLENLALLDRVDQPNWLMEWGAKWESGNETALYYQLAAFMKEQGRQLVVLDSRYDFFVGENNDERHAWEFVSVLRRLARQMNGAVVLTFHPSQTGMNSGSGEFGTVGWHNACRSRLYFRRPKDDGSKASADLRELEVMKANYATLGEPMRLQWDDGAFRRLEEPTGIVASIERRAVEAIFLECLDAAATQGRHVTDAKNSPRYAPKVFAAMSEGKRTSKADFEKAMLALFNTGRIKVGAFTGPDRHPVKAIVRTNGAAGSAGSGVVSD